MDFTFYFMEVFFIGLIYTSPLFITLGLVIIGVGRIIGWIERWSWLDSIYYALITATTVGYGDFHPGSRWSKLLSILVAFTGLVFTGIMVAVALHASAMAFDVSPGYQALMDEMAKIRQLQEGR